MAQDEAREKMDFTDTVKIMANTPPISNAELVKQGKDDKGHIMKLVIVRRPETNKDTGASGEPAAPSSGGQAQLLRVAETCKAQAVQAVFHSLQPRAAMAGEILAKSLGVPSIAQEGLEERNFGDWDEWEWPQIAAELSKLSTDERYTFVPPNGESWQQMEKRLRAALNEMADQGYKSIAVVTHWGPIRVLLPILRNEPKESTLQLEVANGETFVEEYQGA
jgi:broad specificity phosphatase PhoE